MRNMVAILISLVMSTLSIEGTDVFYSDETAISGNGRYLVEGKSPSNAEGKKRIPFQGNFMYTLTDLKTEEVLWRRGQEYEGPCVSLYVDNEGWVVIVTSTDSNAVGNGLIVVNPKGVDVGTARILEDGFTEEEREQYVHNTTIGPMWGAFSRWYFAQTHDKRLFVIRPWWDRRIIVDMERGAVIAEDKTVAEICAALESDFVLRELKKGVETRWLWENGEDRETKRSTQEAIYLAGKLKLIEAVSYLRILEDSPYVGRYCSASREKHNKPIEGRVTRWEWEELTVRRLVHLSLRRLGETPGFFPCTRFEVYYEDYEKRYIYHVPPPNKGRSQGAKQVKVGMSLEGVLDTLGGPDSIDADVWYYDIDASDPYTLAVEWDGAKVTEIEKHRPPFWMTEEWDQEIVY